MPRIRTYDQQVGLANDSQQAPVNPQAAGMLGQGIARVGEAVAGLGETLHRNDVTKDVTNSYEKLSQIRSEYTQRIQKATQDGTITQDHNLEKFQQDYQESLNKITGSTTTMEGSKYLERHGAILGSDLLRTAAISQAHISGQQAAEKEHNGISLDANSIQLDPSSFHSVLEGRELSIEERVKNGNLDSVTAEKMKREAGEIYAHSAIIGLASNNPEQAEAELKSGAFKDYLKPEQSTGLFSQIRAFKENKIAKIKQADELQKIAQKKESEDWLIKNNKSLDDGSFNIDSLYNSPLDFKQRESVRSAFMSKIDKTDFHNPISYKEVLDKIRSGGIKSQSDLYDQVGKGISSSDVQGLTNFMMFHSIGSNSNSNPSQIQADPQAQSKVQPRNMLLKQMESAIIKQDPMHPEQVNAEYMKFNEATNSLMEEENKLKSAGKDPSTLYDPNSNDYFLKKVQQFSPTADDIRNSFVQKSQPVEAVKDTHAGPGKFRQIKQGEDPMQYLIDTGQLKKKEK